MAVRRVDHHDVAAGAEQGPGPGDRLGARADGRGHAKPAVLVLVGVGKLRALEDVLDGDEAAQHAFGVHHRKLLDPVPGQDPLRLLERGAHRRRDELLLRHRLVDRLIEIALELEVAVGDDADQPALAVDDRARPRSGNASSAPRPRGAAGPGPSVMGFMIIPLSLRLTRSTSAAWRSTGMFLWITPMPTRPRHRDGHFGFRDGVHGGGDERNVEGNGAGEAAGDVKIARVHGRVPWHQQNVVECQSGVRQDQHPQD